jgi:hypothetical protein
MPRWRGYDVPHRILSLKPGMLGGRIQVCVGHVQQTPARHSGGYGGGSCAVSGRRCPGTAKPG